MQTKYKAIVLAISISLFYLSYQAWNAAKEFHSPSKRPTIFSNPIELKVTGLELQAQEMRDRLEYMVFTKERDDAQSRLSKSLQQQINLQPWEPTLWRELFFSATESDVSAAERDWLFMVASQLQKWDKYQRLILSNRCITQLHAESDQWRAICRELLAHWPSDIALSRALKIAQVGESDLTKALAFYGLPPMKGQDL